MAQPSMSAGEIIYKAFAPTLKMALCIASGFVITKAGLLSPASNRGMGLITMNLSLPCLIFSSMVSAFTPHTVSAFGPLVMMGILYQIVGGLLSWVVSEIFYVPQDFRWGILVMGIISNWGNLPTAVVQTVAKDSPFNPQTDVDLGVAYIAVFILVMNTTFFALGVHKICGWDFTDDRILGDAPPFKARWRSRFGQLASKHDEEVVEMSRTATLSTTSLEADRPPAATASSSSFKGISEASARNTNAVSLEVPSDIAAVIPDATRQTSSHKYRRKALQIIVHVPPATWSVVMGLIFSLIQPLKALLAHTEGWTGERMPNAPDGNPPLHFILDTATYLGAMTVPMALILLGSSFARLTLPSRWRDVPIMAIFSMTIVKMVIVPIFSIFVVQALQRNTSMFPPQEKIRTFVAILLSGTPAAANQLVVTQLYNPAGTAHTLASFLLLQYVLMFVLSTGLAAIALYIVR